MPERRGSFSGKHLSIQGVPFRSLSIQPDATLADQVEIHARFERAEEFEAVEVREGESVQMVGKPQQGSSFLRSGGNVIQAGGRIVVGDLVGGAIVGKTPTLDVEMRVPPGFTVRLGLSIGEARLGDIAGLLHLDVNGAGKVRAGATKRLDVDLSGAGSVVVSGVAEGADLEMSGSGAVEIGDIGSGALKVDLSGAGSIKVGGGVLDRLSIDVAGTGKVTVGAHVEGDARIEASGIARVEIASVAGQVEQETSGLAKISIASRSRSFSK